MKYLIKINKELFLLNKTISAQKHIIKMKNKIFSALFILILSGNGYAQTPIRYEYDRVGNVILRYKISVQNLQRTIQEKTSGTNPEPIAGKAMKVYPNPTRGVVKIVFSGMGDAIDIQTRLYNSKGSLLKSEISPKLVYSQGNCRKRSKRVQDYQRIRAGRLNFTRVQI